MKKKTSKKKTKKQTHKKRYVKKIEIKKANPKINLIKPAKKNIIKKGERISLGMPIFDKMTKGGFNSESINIIAGGSGSGKTIFAMQFLIEGIKRGEKVLYVTFEEKKQEFYENMLNMGWDLTKLENSGKLTFLEYSPEKVKMMLDEGGGSIETIVLKEKIKRMVIDSITSFSLLFESEVEKRQATLGLFDIIRKWDCTNLFTVQHNPISIKDKGIAEIEFEVDSIILLYNIPIKGERKRFIEILKMRGTNHSKDIYSFEIEKGIRIKKKSKINFYSK